MVDDVRVRAVGKTQFTESKAAAACGAPSTTRTKHRETAQIFFKDRHYESQVYLMDDLVAGDRVQGPCIIMDKLSTILVEPECHCEITAEGDARITVERGGAAGSRSSLVSTELDMIQLSIFSHRFMSIAEQMGGILQRTSISTNIKERCAF